MDLSTDDYDVLAYVVVDPQGWADHAAANFGPDVAGKHMTAKISKYRAAYEAAVALPDYKTRAERDAVESLQ